MKIYFSKNPNNSSASFSLGDLLQVGTLFLIFNIIFSWIYFYAFRFFQRKINIEKYSRKKQVLILAFSALLIAGVLVLSIILLTFGGIAILTQLIQTVHDALYKFINF